MKLHDVIQILESIAPTRFAESWDNVGLLLGDPDQDVARAMLTIDYTPAVAKEALDAKADLIIAYHPPIFQPLKRITAPNLILDAARRGVAIYSPHTALDVGDGGTNDMLADILGLAERAPLRVAETKSNQFKLVTFVPENAVQKVSDALFDAGAGRIGDYTHCSFRSPGTGTFFGTEGTNPKVGQSGKLESADEIRIETIVPIARISQIVQALRASHPYEEPAFDLIQLSAPPEGKGQGRIGAITPAAERPDLFDKIKQGLQVDHLLISGPTTGPVQRAACLAGAGGEHLSDAIAQKADLYLTGEIRHHDALRAAQAGMTVVCALHSNSERPILTRLASRLEGQCPQLAVLVSRMDRDPFAIH